MVERSSVLDPIGNREITALQDLAVEQFKIDLLLHFVKERNA